MNPTTFRIEPDKFRAMPRFSRAGGELVVFWLWWIFYLPVGYSAETAYECGYSCAAGHMPRAWPYQLTSGVFRSEKTPVFRFLPHTYRGPNVRVFMWLDRSWELPLRWTPEAAYQAGYDDGFVSRLGSDTHNAMGADSAYQAA